MSVMNRSVAVPNCGSCDLYAASDQFEFRPDHRLYWFRVLRIFFFLFQLQEAISGKLLQIRARSLTASHLRLFTQHSIIKHEIISQLTASLNKPQNEKKSYSLDRASW